MLKTVPLITAVFLASAFAPTAGQAAESNSVRVSYADLNLAAPPGQQVLQRRIVLAARLVCEFEDSRQLDLAAATNLCRNDAIQGAQPAYQAAVAAAIHPSVTVLGSAAIIVSTH